MKEVEHRAFGCLQRHEGAFKARELFELEAVLGNVGPHPILIIAAKTKRRSTERDTLAQAQRHAGRIKTHVCGRLFTQPQ